MVLLSWVGEMIVRANRMRLLAGRSPSVDHQATHLRGSPTRLSTAAAGTVSDGGVVDEGEQWSRDQLGVLRSAGWRPRAWWRLLRASRERASVIRRQRPVLARQADLWALAATSGALVAGSGCTRRARAGGLAWSGVCWLMLCWHLGMVDRPGREPCLVAGDALTLARLWGSPLVFSVRREQLVGVVALAAVSDVLDGPLARRQGATRLGRDVDSAADLTVLVSAFARPDLLPRTARVALAARVLVDVAPRACLWTSPSARLFEELARAGRVVVELQALLGAGDRDVRQAPLGPRGPARPATKARPVPRPARAPRSLAGDDHHAPSPRPAGQRARPARDGHRPAHRAHRPRPRLTRVGAALRRACSRAPRRPAPRPAGWSARARCRAARGRRGAGVPSW